ADEKEVAAAMGGDSKRAVKMGTAFVVGDRDTIDRLRKNKPIERPELVDALAAAGDATVQMVFLVPADAPRLYEELLPTLPADLGGGPIKIYTRGVRWVALGVDTAPALRLRLTIASPDAASARELNAGLTDRLLPALARQKMVRELVPTAEKIVP